MSESCSHRGTPASAAEVSELRPAASATIGISEIAIYEPPWALENGWFNGSLSRKFEQHTGIRSRRISLEDEVTMAVRAVEGLKRETNCDLRDCVAVLFVSPSVVPAAAVARSSCGTRLREEPVHRLARQFVGRVGLSADCVVGMNWFCSGYTKALSLVHRHILPRLSLQHDQFILVTTVSRISRITDYACPKTAPLFGDMAAVTVLARSDSRKYPVHFNLLIADAQTRAAEKVLFDFSLRENVLVPTPDGGSARDPQRLVFSLDGLGIGDAAPRAMADATSATLCAASLAPEDVQFVVPHQAGAGIVRLAAMKLEEMGVRAEVVNGLTSEAGNVSSCSIPFALKKMWSSLDGTIACPSAGVGPPGEPKVSQGCVLLRATPLHTRRLA